MDTASNTEPGQADGRELFVPERTSRTRIIGLVTVLALLVSGSFTFAMLIGLTPIVPDVQNVQIAALINGILIAVLVWLVGREIIKILRSRKKGRAASRLHVRIIALFAAVAAVPAIIVAVVAAITLDVGLDRWFEIRTKKIVESSISVARAYGNEATRTLMGNTLTMAANIDRNRTLYVLDREGFTRLFTLESRGRGFLAAALVNKEGEPLLKSRLKTQNTLPPIPKLALELAEKGEPVPIPPGETNLIGAVYKLREIKDQYLYTIVAVPPAVIDALRETRLNSQDYSNLERNRLPFQFTFALLYFGLCMIVFLGAIWMGLSVANRIVTPIRRLMSAASEVSDGNLDARVDLTHSEGDLRFLSETFNEMLGDLKNQQGELVDAKELMDQRARFIEAVLSGVSAAVIGVDGDGNVSIANRSATPLLQLEKGNLHDPNSLSVRFPELAEVLERAIDNGKSQHLEQITLFRDGRERTFNVQVTQEEESALHSFVITLDDITDLVAAQRNTAWADVARRIAHEIKNPLTPIQLSAERIKRRYGKVIETDREVFDNCTDTIIRQVGDIGRMVDEFSAFARMPKPEMAIGDLKSVIKDTVFLQKVGFPEITFDLELSDGPLKAVFDNRMISQGLINVIKNAAEAIEGREEGATEKGRIVVRSHMEGDRAVIEIIDNGKGLPKENRQRLLEPYMTTREKGTGLGLAIVRKIAEDHGGTIELLDAPEEISGGSGAMTRMIIPLHNAVAAAPGEQGNISDEKLSA